MAKVRFAFGSVAAFARLQEKRADTIYVINETGDFSSSSLDEEGNIYLGGKLLTGGSGGQMPVQTPANGVILANTLYLLGQLDSDVSLTLDGGFDPTVANEWHVVFATGATPYSVTINAPGDSGSVAYTILGSIPITQSNKTYEVSILYAGAAASAQNDRSGNSRVFLLASKVY